MILEQPSIFVFGLRIDEPVNCATDILVTIVCWYAYAAMRRSDAQDNASRLMRVYFLVMGAATLVGGLFGHAFTYALSPAWKAPAWVISMFAVMFIERAAIEHASSLMPERLGAFFLKLNLVELTVLMVLACYYLEFNYVLIHSAYGLGLVVGGFHMMVWLRTRDEASKRIVQGVLIATFGAVFYASKWGIHAWFNHIDIGHLTMAIATWFFYLGARKMEVGGAHQVGGEHVTLSPLVDK